MRIAKFKIAYNSLIIGPRVLQCENNQKEIIAWEFSDVVKFDIGPSIITRLLLVLEVFFFLYIYISLFPHLKIVLGTWCRVNGVWKPLTKTFTYRQHRTGCLIVVFTNHIYNTPHFKIFEISETSFFSDVEYTFIYVYMFFINKKKINK